MYERDVDSLKKWLKVTMIYMTANSREECHDYLYGLWPIYQDAVKNDCGPVLNALKQELKEWLKNIDDSQRKALQKRLENLHLEPEANTPEDELERLVEATQSTSQRSCDLPLSSGISLCPA